MAYLHEIIDDYYTPIDLANKNSKIFGGIFWTHAYYPHQLLEFWRPNDPQAERATFATNFCVTQAGDDAFKSVVLASPKKESNEEFLFLRAKRRPVVLLVPNMEIPVKKLSRGMTISRPFSLVAQIFSIQDKYSGEAKIPSDFLSDIKNLMYPQLIFLPRKAGLFEVDSLLRLDECQSVFTQNLDPSGYRFSDELVTLVRSQFRYIACDTDDKHYLDLKKICNEL